MGQNLSLQGVCEFCNTTSYRFVKLSTATNDPNSDFNHNNLWSSNHTPFIGTLLQPTYRFFL